LNKKLERRVSIPQLEWRSCVSVLENKDEPKVRPYLLILNRTIRCSFRITPRVPAQRHLPLSRP
jgi:hypothetical protein